MEEIGLKLIAFTIIIITFIIMPMAIIISYRMMWTMLKDMIGYIKEEKGYNKIKDIISFILACILIITMTALMVGGILLALSCNM